MSRPTGTQTIAHDEALTYEWFLGVEHVLLWNTTNHILQTLLAKPAVKILGVSEFTFRLPTLAGAGIYLVSAWLLCRLLFGDGLIFLLTFAMLTLNPQVRDFMVAARGFGLGLGWLLLGMYLIAQLTEQGEFNVEDKRWRRMCVWASLSLALSVASNLTNVFPAICIVVAFGWVGLGGPIKMSRFRDHRIQDFAKYFIAPGVTLGSVILWPYLIQMRPRQFQIAFASASATLRDVFMSSFLDKWTEDIYAPSFGAIGPAAGSWQARVIYLGAYVLLPFLFCFVAFGVFLVLRTGSELRTNRSRQMLVFGGSSIACVFLNVLLHVILHMNYPYSRYCLWVIPFFTISAALTGYEISLRISSRLLKGLGLLVSGAIVLVYAQTLNTKTFRYNAYDRISLSLYRAVEKDAQSQGLTRVLIGGTWWYEPEINFYRLRYRAKWMDEYEVKDKSYWWNTPNTLTPIDYDYFVFIPASDPGLSGARIRTIYHDNKTEATIIAIAHP